MAECILLYVNYAQIIDQRNNQVFTHLLLSIGSNNKHATYVADAPQLDKDRKYRCLSTTAKPTDVTLCSYRCMSLCSSLSTPHFFDRDIHHYCSKMSLLMIHANLYHYIAVLR